MTGAIGHFQAPDPITGKGRNGVMKKSPQTKSPLTLRRALHQGLKLSWPAMLMFVATAPAMGQELLTDRPMATAAAQAAEQSSAPVEEGIVQEAGMPETIPPALDEAVRMVFSDFRLYRQYNYVMTGKIRLLLFWIGQDDVGGGYIRTEVGRERSELESIRLKIGSDPDKAPRDINRWGSATEILERDLQDGSAISTAFFGFMKVTEGETVDAVERELETEGENSHHIFEASINRIDRTVALSSVLPIVSSVDFNIHELDDVDRMVLEQYQSAFRLSKFRSLSGNQRRVCDRNESFLFTVKELIDAAVTGDSTPNSRCYLYNSKLLELTLRHSDPVRHETIQYELIDGTAIEKEYRDLLELKFQVRNPETGWDTDFDLLVGTSGALRGVPVRITYQPEFWFKAILNLHQVSGGL
jgi:hypothetical protein